MFRCLLFLIKTPVQSREICWGWHNTNTNTNTSNKMDLRIFVTLCILLSVCLEIKALATSERSTLLCPDNRSEEKEPNLMEKILNFMFGKKAVTNDINCKSVQRKPQTKEKIKKEATSFQVNYMHWKNKKI